jgi:hypothetical protein
MPNVPSQCQPIADGLKRLNALLSNLEQQFLDASGSARTQLLDEIRLVRQQISSDQVKLEQCINPPVPLPDLTPLDVTIRWNPDRVHFDFAVLIHNNGAPVSGPFKVTLGVEYYDYSQDPPLDVYAEQDFIFPSYIWLDTNDTVPSQYWTNVPFLTRPGTSFASYTFYALVDADDQIVESNKFNNNLQVTKVLKVPRIINPPLGPPIAA